MTVEYLLNNIVDVDREKTTKFIQKEDGYKFNDIYNFVENRLSAVRQDFVRLSEKDNQHCIDCYEKSTRFLVISLNDCLDFKEFFGDQGYFKTLINQINSSLSSLRDFYKDTSRVQKNKEEFYFYSIILSADKPIDLMNILNRVPREARKSPQVEFAMKVCRAYLSHDFLTFFKLLEQSSYLQACMISILFKKMRRVAFKVLSKQFDMDYEGLSFTADKLVRLLKFEDSAELGLFMDWMGAEAVGEEQFKLRVTDKEVSEGEFKTCTNRKWIDQKRKGRTRKEIIIGGDSTDGKQDLQAKKKELANMIKRKPLKPKESVMEPIKVEPLKVEPLVKVEPPVVKPAEKPEKKLTVESKPATKKQSPLPVEKKEDYSKLEKAKNKEKLAVILKCAYKERIFGGLSKIGRELLLRDYRRVLDRLKKYRVFSALIHVLRTMLDRKNKKVALSKVKFSEGAQLELSSKLEYTNFDSKVLTNILRAKLTSSSTDLAVNVTFLSELAFLPRVKGILDRVFPSSFKWADRLSLDGKRNLFFGFQSEVYEGYCHFGSKKNTCVFLCDLSNEAHFENLLKEVPRLRPENLVVLSLYDDFTESEVFYNLSRLQSLMPKSACFAVPAVDGYPEPFHRSVINYQNISLFKLFDELKPISLEKLEFVKLSVVIGHLANISDKYKKSVLPKAVVSSRIWNKFLFDVLA